MYLSSHHVQFVFDRSDDCHYTRTLLRLEPEAFLWFELMQDHQADLVLSVCTLNGIPRVRTFDTASAQFLQQETLHHWFFSPKPMPEELFQNQTIAPAVRSLAELKKTDCFLSWLAEAAELNKPRKVALLVSHEAVPALLETGSFQSLPANCITMLRLPADAAALENVLLKQKDLSNAFPQISQALNRGLTPLMSALRLTMPEQMICLQDRSEDVRNMLLLHTLRDDSCADSVKQLEDQARCLYLLRKHRRLYLLSGRFTDSSAIPALSALSGQLHELREPLRRRTAELLRKHPGLSLDKALELEQLIPRGISLDPCSEQDQTTVFTNDLARNLFSLEKLLCGSGIPAGIRGTAYASSFRDLNTLWNKPRNERVLSFADQFCDRAHFALQKQNWDELKTALYLLQFCADQVCADAAQEENLRGVLELGDEVLSLSQYISKSNWINETLSDLRVPTSSQLSNVAEYTQLIHNAAIREDLDQQQIALLTRRLLLQQKISAFYQPDLDPERLAAELAQVQQSYEQTLDSALHTHTAAPKAPETVHKHTVAVPTARIDPPPASPEPIAVPETTYEEDVRITRQLLYHNSLPGGVNYFDDDDLEENINVEDVE